MAGALGRQALQPGYSLLFTPAPALVARLTNRHLEGRRDARLSDVAQPNLLLVDHLGY